MARLSIQGYERLTQIGKGGFSRVYRGEQAKLKRSVAVKVLNFGLNDEADRYSFERECELMGRVSTHPNIVTVHDTAFTADGRPCIVMEYYPGGSLADLISEVRQLNPKEVLEVGVQIASALEASHQSGVLHCDLKPQNILISEFGQPALGDFGISTFTEERTRTGGGVSRRTWVDAPTSDGSAGSGRAGGVERAGGAGGGASAASERGTTGASIEYSDSWSAGGSVNSADGSKTGSVP